MLTYRLLVSICWLINRLPLAGRVFLLQSILQIVIIIIPRLRDTALVNLSIAFPEKSEAWHKAVLQASLTRFARGLVDTLRLPSMNGKWVKENVEFPDCQLVIDTINEAPNQSVIFVTGHYNSFEILPRCISEYIGRTGYFMARAIKNKHIDRWWNELRGEQGNAVISRAGGVKKMIDLLKSGKCVGLVFDHNVTRKQAVFVDWFGQAAATTKALAYCQLRLKVPIILVTIHQSDSNRYKIQAEIFKYTEDIFNSKQFEINEESLKQVTERVSNAFTKIVQEQPEGWFWLHRRWRTRPSENDIAIY